MPMRCRTNWWLSERETPEMPNQKTTCSSGETWPVFRRSSTDWAVFSDERQGRQLSSLCERVARDDGSELIVLGDAFDFTAMQPPPKGLGKFFRELDVPREEPRRRTLPELLAAVRESNPVALESLATLTESAPVTFVPGNHDYQLGEPGAGDALASAGLPPPPPP